jgi:hypothetical protein
MTTYKVITERQLQYLNILLNRYFGDNRKLYLSLFYDKESSKDLSVLEASEIIEKFVDENPDKDKNISMALNEIYKKQGQKSLL